MLKRTGIIPTQAPLVHLQSCERDHDRPARLLERVVESGNELAGVGREWRQDERDIERGDAGAVAQDSHNVNHGVYGPRGARAIIHTCQVHPQRPLGAIVFA